MEKVLGKQGLPQTLINTNGFKCVLKLVEFTTVNNFDLLFGLYKYDHNSMDTNVKL